MILIMTVVILVIIIRIARGRINHVANIAGQFRFDSRGVTNTLDSKSYSSGRGNRGL